MVIKIALDQVEQPKIGWSLVRLVRWMADYGDTGVCETIFYCCCNEGSSVVMVKCHVFGARRRFSLFIAAMIGSKPFSI